MYFYCTHPQGKFCFFFCVAVVAVVVAQTISMEVQQVHLVEFSLVFIVSDKLKRWNFLEWTLLRYSFMYWEMLGKFVHFVSKKICVAAWAYCKWWLCYIFTYFFIIVRKMFIHILLNPFNEGNSQSLHDADVFT